MSGWFSSIAEVSVGSDGSLAVLESGRWFGHGTALSFYDAEGDPVRTVETPAGTRSYDLAFAGDWVAMERNEEGAVTQLLFNTSRDSFYDLDLDQLLERDGNWYLFLSPTGKELWAVDLRALTLERFRLPD